MKTIVALVIGSIVSTLIIIQVLFLLFAAKPEVFGVVNNSQSADSLLHNVALDSAGALITEHHGDTLIAETSTEKIPVELLKKKISNDSKIKKEEPTMVTTIPAVDSVDVKAQAKMLEAMGADGAAKVMSTMNDTEVKAILPKLKKRTAAKILVSFDPNRAARLLR